MSTTFGWKRKIGQNVSKNLVETFSVAAEEAYEIPTNLSWIKSYKKKRTCLQENCKLKSDEFKSAGIKYAENKNFRAAVIEWDKALNLVPNDYKILEMKAQALLQLNCGFPAVQAAEKSVRLNSQWWVAYQTLGRCQLAIGDIQMAKKSFSKAIHLDPSVQELWDEDLNWALTLIKRKSCIEQQTNCETQLSSDAAATNESLL